MRSDKLEEICFQSVPHPRVKTPERWGGSAKPYPGGDVGWVEEKKKKKYVRGHEGREDHRHRQNSRRERERECVCVCACVCVC